MSIGLMRGTVAVEPHKIEWEIAAREMIERLKNILMDDIVDAQHIGSTSIKSICAKPIVDIVVGVNSFDSMMRHNDELRTNGIVYCCEDHPGQHLYVVGDLHRVSVYSLILSAARSFAKDIINSLATDASSPVHVSEKQ